MIRGGQWDRAADDPQWTPGRSNDGPTPIHDALVLESYEDNWPRTYRGGWAKWELWTIAGFLLLIVALVVAWSVSR